MFEMRCRIRYSEIDYTGRLSMSGLLRLFQDCGYEHARLRRLDFSYTEKTRCTWYLLSWHIHAYKMPRVGEDVVLKTCVYGSGGSIARKSIQLFDASGRLLAAGDTLWVYMNVDTQQPAEQPEGLWPERDYGVPVKLPDNSRRIVVKGEKTPLPPLTAPMTLIDTNDHANNVKLTELAMQLCGMELSSQALRAEFKQQVVAGMTLLPVFSEDAEQRYLVMKNEAGETMANFSFRKKPE